MIFCKAARRRSSHRKEGGSTCYFRRRMATASSSPSKSRSRYDPGLDEQVYDYIKALREPQVRRKYRDFCDSYVVTLTPARKEITTKAHGHLSWGDIRRLMQGCGDRAIASELLGFAEFLELRHLSPVDMPPLTRDLWSILPGLLHSSQRSRRLFDRFANDRILKTFFRRFALSRPTVGFDYDENMAWYGIWDTRKGRSRPMQDFLSKTTRQVSTISE